MEVSIRIQDNAGSWHELDAKDVEIVMTKQFADLEDPSSINAAYTLDAKLPYTDTNNRILKDLYRIDYVYGGGNEFNQKEKHPCIVSHGQDIIYRGTMTIDGAQINEADARNNYYSITIYDEMYDLFTKLDYTISEPAESFDGVTDKNINIGSMNAILSPLIVKSSFENVSVATDNMHYTNNACDYYLNQIDDLDVTNTVGFLPTYKEQSADEEKTAYFSNDGKSLIYWTGGTINWTEIKDGVPARKYCEAANNTWKDYDCKPYLYYSAYLDFLFAEIYRSTGYKVNRNTNFFHPTNPYWSKLIRTCKYIKGGSEADNTWRTISTYTNVTRDFYTNKIVEKTGANMTLQGSGCTNISTFNPSTLDVNKKYRILVKANVTPAFQIKPYTFEANPSYVRVKLDKSNYLSSQFKVNLTYSGTLRQRYTENLYLIPDDRKNGNPTDGINLLYEDHKYRLKSVGHFRDHTEPFVTVPALGWDCYWWDGDDIVLHCSNDSSMTYLDNETGREPAYVEYVDKIDIPQSDVSSLKMLVGNVNMGIELLSHFTYLNKSGYYCSDANGILGMRLLFRNVVLELQEYTQPKVDYMSLLGDDFNILEAITEFAKTFNLVVDVNYADKTINFNQRGEYYTNYRNSNQGIVIDDWSSNVNLKENLEHTAVISDYKAIKYSYEDRDTANNVYSKETANMNASTVIRDLDLPVNSEEENYLEGLYNSYVGRVDTYNIFDYIINKNTVKRTVDQSIPLYIDKTNTNEGLDDVSGQLLFRHQEGINCSDTIYVGNNKRPIVIVQDTEWEKENDEYVLPLNFTNLSQLTFAELAHTAPSFDVVTEDGYYCSEWVNKIGNELIDNSKGLYDVWHARWNNLIYGIQGTNQTNKKVTAYFHVPLDQYAAWNFSHLIRIDNNIYIVLSIDEYSFNNGVMKATLIQITNPYALGQIDPTFAEDYLYVMPTVRRLSKGTGLSVTYRVWCSKPLTYTMETANFPTWLTGATATRFTTKFVSKGYCKEIEIAYLVDSATYPTTQDTNYGWVSFDSTDGTWSADYGKAYGYCTNYPIGYDYNAPMTITPYLQYSPNANGVYKTFGYQLVSDFDVSLLLTDYSTHSVFHITSYTVNKTGTNTMNLGIVGTSNAGQAGERMTLTVKNTIGQTCVTMIERETVEFNHQETIEGENGDTDIQRWDYKTINDPLQSTYRFTVRTNYDFTIRKWAGQGTMWDNGIQEYCSDPTIKDVILRDMSDPQNPADYDGESQPFVGQANNTYTLEWHYYRRLGINNTKYDGYFDIQCIDGHSVPAYKKKVNVFCNVQNDQP